jgi:hypothetical protein
MENIGTIDRILRAIVGLIGIYLGLTVSPWFYILAVLGLGTAIIGWCGLYTLLGINTKK